MQNHWLVGRHSSSGHHSQVPGVERPSHGGEFSGGERVVERGGVKKFVQKAHKFFFSVFIMDNPHPHTKN